MANTRKTKVAKNTPKVDKYTEGGDGAKATANEPEVRYKRKTTMKKAGRRSLPKPYDAKRSSGMIPGIAERMKEYLRVMRDDR